MRVIFVDVTAFLLCLTASTPARSSGEETFGHFVIAHSDRMVGLTVEYCAKSVPSLRRELLEERAGFTDKMIEAGKPLIEKLDSDPNFNAPVQEDVRQEMAKLESHAMATIKQHDPVVICNSALKNMQSATVEILRPVVEDNYRKMQVALQRGDSD